ncbi:1199_t:CDS:2 [Funneliformis mosseae]|uniref:1199_t:CDS:1 n=1 Tax=Funneliformis mosseae TaxID=27381 RepID=A0A9N9CJG5_FUNMO|nr:1199_t:CDS:2 [Funneliformis mosseae]
MIRLSENLLTQLFNDINQKFPRVATLEESAKAFWLHIIDKNKKDQISVGYCCPEFWECEGHMCQLNAGATSIITCLFTISRIIRKSGFKKLNSVLITPIMDYAIIFSINSFTALR